VPEVLSVFWYSVATPAATLGSSPVVASERRIAPGNTYAESVGDTAVGDVEPDAESRRT
jgi:hypothetical protein